LPPVDDKIAAGNEIGVMGGEEHGGAGNTRWVTGTPERDFPHKFSLLPKIAQ